MTSKQYTIGEEIANVLTHFVAALISIYGIIILVTNSKNILQVVSTAIFGITLFLLFQSSVFYHAITNETTKKIFQKIDHSAIYMLIAGTYTPALLLTVKTPLNFILVAIVWVLALVGIIFSCINIESKRMSAIIYLIMGWLSVFFVYNVWITSHLSVWLMLGGGLFYSLGCIFYLTKSRYMHSIWHLFVIGGAVMHFFAIMELLKAIN